MTYSGQRQLGQTRRSLAGSEDVQHQWRQRHDGQNEEQPVQELQELEVVCDAGAVDAELGYLAFFPQIKLLPKTAQTASKRGGKLVPHRNIEFFFIYQNRPVVVLKISNSVPPLPPLRGCT